MRTASSRCNYQRGMSSVLLVMIVAFFCSQLHSLARASDKVTVGTVFKGSIQWPLFIAEEKGFFKERDLEVEHLVTRGAQNSAQQLAAGSLNIAESGFPPFIRAIDKGAPIKIIFSDVGTPPYRVFGKKDLKSAKDLEGKTIIIGGARDVTKIYLEALLSAHGLEPGEYEYVYAGSTPSRFAALMSGGVDAAILLPPFDFKAAAEGYSNLGNIQTYLSDFPFTVYAVNTDWAKDHQRAVTSFVAGYMKAIDWLYDPANKDEAIEILVNTTDTSPEDARKTYDLFVREIGAYSKSGKLTPEAFDKMMKALVEWGDIKEPVPALSKFFDDSYLKATSQ